MVFTIGMSASITNEWMTKVAYVPVTVLADEGHKGMFVDCKKLNKPLMRAILAGTPYEKKYMEALTRTNILEMLTAEKDKVFLADLNTPEKKKRRYSRGFKLELLQMSEVKVIQAPAVAGVAGVAMNVVINKPGNTVKMELTAENLGYLRCCFLAQLENGGIKRQHARYARDEQDRVDVEAKGVSFSYTRGKYRVKDRTFTELAEAVQFTINGSPNDDGQDDERLGERDGQDDSASAGGESF
jgi:hypothetical protein